MNKSAPTPTELHQLSGQFFYDEQNIVQDIYRMHVMSFGLWNSEHTQMASCWCGPTLTHEDEAGFELWEHNTRA